MGKILHRESEGSKVNSILAPGHEYNFMITNNPVLDTC